MSEWDNGEQDAASDICSAGQGDTVDASWWVEVSQSQDVVDFEPAEVLHDLLQDLAMSAGEESGIDSLRARTLTAMARATSAMLAPDSRADPFIPAMQWAGRRSDIPSDLDDDELELLAEALPHVKPVVLRARLADVVWTFRFPRDPAVAAAAIEAYITVPLTWDAWTRSAHDGYRRAIQLARSRGNPGLADLDAITARLLEFVSTGHRHGGFLAQVSQVLRTAGSVSTDRCLDLGGRLSRLATNAPSGTPSERALLREATAWYRRANENEEALACQVRLAGSYAEEAELAVRTDRGALLASTSMERSLEVLRELPRRYREANDLEHVLASRRAKLRELRQYSLEEMTPMRGREPEDIYKWVDHARRHVAGRDRLAALLALTQISPLTDLDEQTAEVREDLTHSLIRLVSRTTLSSDARKVGASVGDASAAPTDEEILNELVRRNAHRIGLVLQALIVPAAETISYEHRFDLAFVEGICRESSTVPMRHAGLWARGIWHGLNGDFPSSVSILIPQIEQMVRLHLKSEGVHTLFVGEAGVETEKAFGALLETEQASAFLGRNLAFELRALLLEPVGPNLRNELAHGLVTDSVLWSGPAIYTWWLALRIALAPLALIEEAPGHPADEQEDSQDEASHVDTCKGTPKDQSDGFEVGADS